MDKINILKKLGYLVLIVFTGLFFILIMGYYETAESKKATLTSEQIIKFEQAIAKGEDVTIDDYLTNNYVDYSNNFSKNMTKISDTIEIAFEKSVKYIFKEIADSVEND